MHIDRRLSLLQLSSYSSLILCVFKLGKEVAHNPPKFDVCLKLVKFLPESVRILNIKFS